MARVMGHYGLLFAIVLAVLLACGGTVLAQSTGPGEGSRSGQSQRAYQSAERLQLQKPGSGQPGALSAVQKRAIEQGYLVPDQAAYEQAKDEANAKAESSERDEDISPAGGQDPQTIRSFEGLKDPTSAPSDSTGAIGPDRYIELVNSKFAIYDRTNDAPLFSGSLNDLAGESPSANVFDPQIIWDPDTNRFFYTADDVLSATDNRLAFGFSKTATPSSADDFCKYAISYGKRFPDFPKLGDTQNFILIGVNTFNSRDRFVGSDLNSISKPPPGSACPRTDTFTFDRLKKLESNGDPIFTPVPANQTDGSDTGYIVARPLSVPASELAIYEATENAGSIDLSVSELAVPMYDIPANAKQPGKKSPRLDTSDTRNTQAVSAIDPSESKVALWTQHTVFGGGGARVRWYEIDPSVPSLFQSDIVSSSKSFVFNGAISPDRLVNGATTAFGDSMVLGFSTSAKEQRPDINMVSKVGSNAVSEPVLIKDSSASLDDFSCSGGVCRWGDYSAATPDPGASSSAPHGQVWLSNQWVRRAGGNSGAGWGTWNWAATP